MSLNRFAKRRDCTERAIIDSLRAMGFKVLQTNFPDLVVRRPIDGKIFLLEVAGITKHRKRARAQLDFIRDWHIPIVKNLDEALAWVRGS